MNKGINDQRKCDHCKEQAKKVYVYIYICIYTYIWAFSGAQRLQNPPAVQKMQLTQIQILLLGWEDPLEEVWQPTPAIWPGESHGQRSLVVHRVAKSLT